LVRKEFDMWAAVEVRGGITDMPTVEEDVPDGTTGKVVNAVGDAHSMLKPGAPKNQPKAINTIIPIMLKIKGRTKLLPNWFAWLWRARKCLGKGSGDGWRK
jgi:hypothetical protein